MENGVPITLVYNPTDFSLPPRQKNLQEEFKKKLSESYGIKFTALITMANVPVGRFAKRLKEKGYFEDYIHIKIDQILKIVHLHRSPL